MKTESILVIGDIMLDSYVEGHVKRVSPEAPIPVVNIQREYDRLGGAANVANNISELIGTVALGGIIGNDKPGNSLLSLCKTKGIDTECIITEEKVDTINKIRVCGNGQQLVRIDYNDNYVLQKEERERIQKLIEKKVNETDYDVVVLSDYNKGLLSDTFCRWIITICKEKNMKIIVDPKGFDWNKYSGATVITPNIKELSDYMGTEINNDDEVIEGTTSDICSKLDIQNILVTRSEKGMSLITENRDYHHFRSEAREVFDVSGAGDTVVAALACALAKKEKLEAAIKYANIAAGIVVGKKGTATVSQHEIEAYCRDMELFETDKKILRLQDLITKVEQWKASGEKTVFTNGCFDVFHRGHVTTLQTAAQFGTKLIVAINSDSSVKRIKGEHRPINTEMDRACVIAAIGCVDAVIIFEEDTPFEVLSVVKPDILVKGSDYKVEEVIGREFVSEVKLVPIIKGVSSTAIINKMSEEHN